MDTSAIRRAREIVGSTRELAAITGVTPGAVSQWCQGVRPVPVGRALLVELATAGKVTVEQMRPDLPWSVMRPNPARKAA